MPSNRVIYLDYANVSPISRDSAETIADYYRLYSIDVNPREFVKRTTESLDGLRRVIKEHLGLADDWKVVLTRSATESINIVAAGINWKIGQEIVISDLEHQSNILPWINAAQLNSCSLRIIPGKNGVVETQLLTSISQHTKLVSITLMSHIHGIFQEHLLTSFCKHQSSPLVMLDASQAVGRVKLDLTDIQCDFIVGSGRKGLNGPIGTGFLAIRDSAFNMISPRYVSTRNVTLVDGDLRYSPYPAKLEFNMPNIGCLLALEKSVLQIQKTGIARIQHSLTRICDSIAERLRSLPGVRLSVDTKNAKFTGIISFFHENLGSQEIVSLLQMRGIQVGIVQPQFSSQKYVRISPSYDIDDQTIDVFFEELRKILS